MLPALNVLIRKSNKVQNSDPYQARSQILRDIFFSPKSAFESYYQKTELASRDLFLIHLNLVILAGISKFFGNLLSIFLFKISTSDEESNVSLFDGVVSVILFYVLVIVLLRLTDSFRMYHQMRDKSKDWSGPEPHVFLISFLPLTSTSIFWCLPQPIPILFLGLGFLYSLHLAYLYLSVQRSWSTRDFFFLLIKVVLFFLVFLTIPMVFYHIIRTALN